MSSVPHDLDMLGEILDNRTRIARRERECNGGETVETEEESNVGVGDEIAAEEPVATTIERDPIIFLEGLTRASGKLTGAQWTKVGDCKIIGYGVDPDTYVAVTVELRGTYARKSQPVATANAEMFRLPPGWWPTEDQVIDLGANGQVTIYAGAGLVVYEPPSTPWEAQPIVLDGVSFAAGGGTCPGFTENHVLAFNDDDTLPDDPDNTVTTVPITSDPTGAGDGQQWDCCEQALDPLIGGAGISLTWTDMNPTEIGITTDPQGGAQWSAFSGPYLTRGTLTDTVPETHATLGDGTVDDGLSITGPDVPAAMEAPGVVAVFTDADTYTLEPCVYTLSSAYMTVSFKRSSLSGIDRLVFHLDGLVFPPLYPN